MLHICMSNSILFRDWFVDKELSSQIDEYLLKENELNAAVDSNNRELNKLLGLNLEEDLLNRVEMLERHYSNEQPNQK